MSSESAFVKGYMDGLREWCPEIGTAPLSDDAVAHIAEACAQGVQLGRYTATARGGRDFWTDQYNGKLKRDGIWPITPYLRGGVVSLQTTLAGRRV